MGTYTALNSANVTTIRHALDRVFALRDRISVVFVTNIRQGTLTDVGEDGVVNAAQHYTEQEADEIIRGFQNRGFHVVPYLSENEFIHEVLNGKLREKSRELPIVYTTAEGGSGGGRRALLPAFCKMNALAYCNSPAHACSIARHKFHANAVLQQVGLPVPAAYMVQENGRWLGGQQPRIGEKVIVKPMYESMSIGIDADSTQIVDESFGVFVQSRLRTLRQPMVVQQFVSGYEIAAPILVLDETIALPLVAFTLRGEPRFGSEARTFDIENLSDDVTFEHFEAVSESVYGSIQSIAIEAFGALEMEGMGRIDMRIDEDGRPWIFDTNESPPPLPQTSYAKSLQILGFDADEMLAIWLYSGLERAGMC